MSTLNDLLIAAELNLASYKESDDDKAIKAGEIMVMGIEAAMDNARHIRFKWSRYENNYFKNGPDSS